MCGGSSSSSGSISRGGSSGGTRCGATTTTTTTTRGIRSSGSTRDNGAGGSVCMSGGDTEQPAAEGQVLEADGDGGLLGQHPRQQQLVLALQVVRDRTQEVHVATA